MLARIVTFAINRVCQKNRIDRYGSVSGSAGNVLDDLIN
jgi:hypothetical protein